MRKELKLRINGVSYELAVEPKTLLVELLRNELGLTGTKMPCSDSACGGCTVILDKKAVKSCSILALQADGKDVLTIEGVAEEDRLSPIQESFVRNHGFQCGYCTPGMILAAKALLDGDLNPTEHEVRKTISGHICRCGTYPKIVESILEAAKVMREDKK